jgi:striatin 1/3/4
MPEAGKDFPLLNGANILSGPSSAPASAGSQIPSLERSNPLGSGSGSGSGSVMQLQQQQQQQQAQTQQQQGQGQQPHNPDKDRDGEEPGRLTAIFRPDDAGEWKERLRLSHEEARQAGAASWGGREDDDGKDEEVEVEDEDTGVVGEGEGTKVWKAKRTLRNHLDAVRALAFHPSDLCLATGGDDCTVKIWRMDVNSLASSAYVISLLLKANGLIFKHTPIAHEQRQKWSLN